MQTFKKSPYRVMFTLFTACPWHICLIMSAAICLLLLRYSPGLGTHSDFINALARILPLAAAIPGLIFLVAALTGVVTSYKRKRQRRIARTLDRLAALPQKAFVKIIISAYAHQGYRILNHSELPVQSGIVDLMLMKDFQKYLVHISPIQNFNNDKTIISQLVNLMGRLQAGRIIMITRNTFGQSVRDSAAGHPVDLLEGMALYRLARRASKTKKALQI
jgi:predicted histidine transporter YuiF (NhaC family)